MTYIDEYRRMLPEEVMGVVNANGISSRVGPDEPWETADVPIGTQKQHLSYEDLVYEDHRVTLMRRWTEINAHHAVFGCPLDPAEDNSWSPCVIHGNHHGDKEMTLDEFLGSYVTPERPTGQRGIA